MSIPKVDGRKAWLDENEQHAHNFLTTMMRVEDKRKLSLAEINLKQISASYIYLYELTKQSGLLDKPDELIEFLNETIH